MNSRLCAFVLAITTLLGQPQPGGPPMFTVTTRLVEVNVIARTRTAWSTISPRMISFFTTTASSRRLMFSRSIPGKRARRMPGKRPRRAHRMSSQTAPQARVNKSTRSWWCGTCSTPPLPISLGQGTGAQELEGDPRQVTVSACTSSVGPPQILQDFTSDSSRLTGAIEKYATWPDLMGTGPPQSVSDPAIG